MTEDLLRHAEILLMNCNHKEFSVAVIEIPDVQMIIELTSGCLPLGFPRLPISLQLRIGYFQRLLLFWAAGDLLQFLDSLILDNDLRGCGLRLCFGGRRCGLLDLILRWRGGFLSRVNR